MERKNSFIVPKLLNLTRCRGTVNFRGRDEKSEPDHRDHVDFFRLSKLSSIVQRARERVLSVLTTNVKDSMGSVISDATLN